MAVTLRVPAGTLGYPISYGTTSFEPYPDGAGRWLIDVPDHVAVHLLHVGGFSVAKRERPGAGSGAKPGLVRMRHAERIGCSFAGQACEPDADGVVLVPAEAAAGLAAHGFVAVEDRAAE